MSNSPGSFEVRGWAKKQEGRNFWVAAFSKTLLIWLFSLVVGHGAPHRRHGGDGGRRRKRGSS
jgi:hypothetical protein